MNTPLRLALISLTLGILTACSGPTNQPDPNTPIQVVAQDGTVMSVQDLNLNLISGDLLWVSWLPNTTWSSDRPSVLSVQRAADGSASVQAVGSGTTTLHGVYTPLTSLRIDLKVTVKAGAVTAVSVSPSSATLDSGAQQALAAVVSGRGKYSQTVTWQSSNAAVASVNGSGLVTALSAGTATITATSVQDTNKSATASITVKVPTVISSVTGVAVTPSSASLNVGATQPLTSTVSGTGNYSTTVTWQSSNAAVASVNGSGLVTALSAGTATITATSTQDTSKSGSASITVKVPTTPSSITGVTVSPTSASLNAGTTQTLTSTVTGTGNYSTAVTWKSSDAAVASVSNGVVTALSAGTATITATSMQDTSKSATASITVKVPSTVTGVTVSPTSATLTVGGTQTLTSTVSGTGSYSTAVTWKSGNTAVASVTSAGVVKAISAGTTTIIATSTQDSSKTASATITVKTASTGGDAFNITIVFPASDGLSATQRAAFQTAARRWEQVIAQGLTDVSGVPVAGQTLTVDDVAIEASAISIDGVGNILGKAGPYYVRSSGLPLTGVMQFDSADLASMESRGILVNVITHEMGHVLGIGTLWSANVQMDASTCTAATSIKYTGTSGLNAYKNLGGQVAWVPVEDQYSTGTKCGHWKESVFKTELMTGFANLGSMPLSSITVGALADLGYSVNYAAADSYSIPDVSAQGLSSSQEIHEELLKPNPVPFPGAK